MSATRYRSGATLCYGVAVGVLGWGLIGLLWHTNQTPLPLGALLLFTLLSLGMKRLGFRVSQNVTHSLVGVVDLAALFSLGTLAGIIVSTVSGAICQILCNQQRPRNPWIDFGLRPLFGGGLNALMMLAAAATCTALGGTLPLLQMRWAFVPAILGACLTWFVLDHAGWALVEFIQHGRQGALDFLRAILPYSLLIELVPLPTSILISAIYLEANAPLFVLMVLVILGVGIVLRQLVVALRAERDRATQLATIAEVSRKVASILGLQNLFADITKLIQETFGYYHVSILTVDAERQEVFLRASSNPLVQKRGLVVPWGQGIIGHAAVSGQMVLANDVLQDARFLADNALEETRSELAVPLKVESRVVGVLDLQNSRPGAFGERDIFVLQSLADQMAIAIEDSRLYEAQQEQTWVSTALLQVAEAVAQLSTADEILDTITRLTLILTGVERCLVFLWSEESHTFTAVKSAGLPRAQALALENQPFGADAIPLLERVQREGQVVHAPAAELHAFLPPPLAADPRAGLLMALPLRSKGEVKGVLITEDLDADTRMVQHRQAILMGIANYAAMALENAQLYTAQREEAWVSTALLQVANMISASTDIEEISSTVVRLTPLLVGVRWCALLLWDEGRRAFVDLRAHGLTQEGVAALRGQTFCPADVPLFARLMTNVAPISVPDAADPAWLPASLGQVLGAGPLTALPARVRERPIGALLVGHHASGKVIPTRRMNILLGIANQAALAFEAAHLYQQAVQQERLQREIELARDIQQSFLPECCPYYPGWQLGVEWRAARGVGGDFYDFIDLDEHTLGLVIADVSDKGVAAALYMALSRTVMHAAAMSTRSPAETLRQANRILMESSRSGMFVSMFYGILDRASGSFTYARAGHNPPLWVRAMDHTITALDPTGVVLGVVDNPELVEQNIQLDPGDLLVMYTDGVIEAINEEDEEFSEERLQQIVAGGTGQNALDLVERIDAAVRVFTGDQAPFDDFTLVVLKRESA